ncbi:MAG: HWE histidine kinase domain-containing protein [Methylocella sp.]
MTKGIVMSGWRPLIKGYFAAVRLIELNHRTQNTLATVQAIAVQTLRGVADTKVVDAFEGRILALAERIC